VSSPMFDLPDHLLIPVDGDGNGPVDEADAHHWACWCGRPDCGGNTEGGG
jgi:hypothetical protein